MQVKFVSCPRCDYVHYVGMTDGIPAYIPRGCPRENTKAFVTHKTPSGDVTKIEIVAHRYSSAEFILIQNQVYATK